MNTEEFKRMVRQKGEELYRDMPWRNDTRPYYILVSELMLQQTQVTRVITKFNDFIERFPDESALASASLAEVLTLWQGLGYNRRAKFLHEAAKRVIFECNGVFPNTYELLVSLPGVGKNTAGAILAYSFNQPVIFVETNIRTIYFYHFFEHEESVDDKQIVAKLSETLDYESPREFYWALMDYGSWLKANGVHNIASSKHYKKQSKLEGSVRQVRGQIIRVLSGGDITRLALAEQISADSRFETALTGLLADGLISESNGVIHLTK